MNRGSKGEDVKQLQRALLTLGYALPRWGVDGELGDETMSAMLAWSRGHEGRSIEYQHAGLPQADVDRVIIQAAHKSVIGVDLPEQYYDCRERAMRSVDKGPRSWSNVRGICLHQTACVMGENAPRYDGIGAHIAITRSGKVFHMHDFNRLVWHGNGWNAQTVGVEIDGLYAGIQGDAKTVWDNPETVRHETGQDLTEAAAESARQTIRWICQEIERNGGKANVLVAHRQSSDARRNDPGSEIWQRVALPMHAELGLNDGGTGFKIGTGAPIPEAWDPEKKGIRY